MQLYNQIKGIFFLGIFIVLMLHNFLPHVHPLQENSHNTLSEHAGHGQPHDHAPHHPHQEEEGEEGGGFLSLLLRNHAHFTYHEHNVPFLKKLEQSEIKKQQQFPPFQAESFHLLMRSCWEGKNHFVPYRYRFKAAYLLYNLSLRAPPFLG